MAKRSAKAAPTSNNDRALPVISVYRLHDKINQVLGILRAHDHGNFSQSAPFVDEMHTDDRIHGVSSTRIGAILSAPVSFKPAGTSDLQQKVAEEIGGTNDQPGIWEEIVSTATAADTLKWGQHLGFGFGKIGWGKTAQKWKPRLIPWHPSAVRWDWMSRRFIAQTERGGQVTLPRPDEMPRGDGQWFLYCPYGVEYGWRSGLIRSLCWKYISRQWSERDHDRLNERHGMGILKAIVPANSQPEQREDFFRKLESIGSEAVAMTTKAADGTGFDIDKVEFTARTWESFNTRRDRLDTDIAITILGQNLTTEVKGGSHAAALVHEVLRIDKALQDAKFAVVVRQQILTWYCEYNYGDPELAPTPIYEVEPPDDSQGEALALKTLGEAGTQLLLANPRTDIEAIWETHGIPQISEAEMAAIEAEQEEERAAAEAKAADAAKNLPPGGNGGVPPAGGGAPAEEEQPGGKKPTAALSSLAIKNRYEFLGLPIAVEHPAGSIRLWADPDGTQGATKMLFDYGFIESGHLSGDAEEVDCYVGSFEGATDVYVIHQRKAPKYLSYDEDKVMLGFASAEEAKAAYLAHRDDGERAFGTMTVFPLDEFKAKLRRRPTTSTTKIRASALGGSMAATTRALVALAERSRGAGAKARLRTAAGKARESKYQDALTKRGIELGARALAPSLQHLKDDIDKASSLAALRKALPGRLKGMDLKGLADVLYRTNVLSRLAGLESGQKET